VVFITVDGAWDANWVGAPPSKAWGRTRRRSHDKCGKERSGTFYDGYEILDI
jgi:hypothetical protein